VLVEHLDDVGFRMSRRPAQNDSDRRKNTEQRNKSDSIAGQSMLLISGNNCCVYEWCGAIDANTAAVRCRIEDLEAARSNQPRGW
jgi:hypothetical protein